MRGRMNINQARCSDVRPIMRWRTPSLIRLHGWTAGRLGMFCGRRSLRRICGGGLRRNPAMVNGGGHFGGQSIASMDSAQRGGSPRAGARIPRVFRGYRHVPSKTSVLAEAICATTGAGNGASDAGLGCRRCPGCQTTGLDRLDRLFIGSGTIHAEQKVVLVLDEENENILTQLVLIGRHVMLGMGEHSRLEDGGQIGRSHAVLIGFGGKDGQKIEDVEQQLLVQRRQFPDQLLIGGNGFGVVEKFCLVCRRRALDLALVRAQGLAELLIEVQGHDRLGQLVEITTEDVGGIMHGVAGPIEAFSVTFGGVEDFLKVLDSFCRSVEAKDTLHIGCYWCRYPDQPSPALDRRKGIYKGTYPFPSGTPHTLRPQ